MSTGHPTSSSSARPWIQRLYDPLDGDLVFFFRVVFGLISLSWVSRQLNSGAVEAYYSDPRLHFHYWGFGWIPEPSAEVIKLEFAVIGLAAALVTVGACYRVASLVFAIGFTHLFLLDKCLYQNHYYLVCLVAWLMVVIPAHRALSVDAVLFPARRKSTVPRWALWLLRFQVAMPYVFGGIAKINADWLAGEPIRTMLAERTHLPWIGPFFTQEWCVQFFLYGGMLLDLLVVPALLYSRTRLVGVVAAVGFHLANANLFTIGIFPWFMLFSIPIYFPPGTLRSIRNRILGATAEELRQPIAFSSGNEGASVRTRHVILVYGLTLYAAWQVALPFRHFAIPGNVNWTEEGHCFSWHMLLRGKRCALRYIATDRNTGRRGTVDLREYVTGFQLNRVSRDPRLIHQLANSISNDLRNRGFQDIEIRALTLVSMNGRKPQLLVDPRVNLAEAKQTWRKPDWIVPLKEPLPDEPWNLPLSQWEQAVPIPEEYAETSSPINSEP